MGAKRISGERFRRHGRESAMRVVKQKTGGRSDAVVDVQTKLECLNTVGEGGRERESLLGI
jgi:hypothetical protein